MESRIDTTVTKYITLLKLIVGSNRLKSHTGATHKNKTLEESINYISRVFDDYVRYAALGPREIEGKRILEIGPGDNFGVAVKFIAQGAQKVVCLDRYECEKDLQQQSRIYEALLRTLGEKERHQALEAVFLSGERYVINPQKVQYVFGKGIENIDSPEDLSSRRRFDLIVSRAVLQYVDDPVRAFAAMDRLLEKGGMMIHRIDLRDHGLFTRKGMDPMEFLTVPDFIWKRIHPHAGKINRHRIDSYRKKLTDLGYDFKILVTHVMGHSGDLVPHPPRLTEGRDFSGNDLSLVRRMRPRLLSRFRQLSDEDLLTSGILVVARKP